MKKIKIILLTLMNLYNTPQFAAVKFAKGLTSAIPAGKSVALGIYGARIPATTHNVHPQTQIAHAIPKPSISQPKPIEPVSKSAIASKYLIQSNTPSVSNLKSFYEGKAGNAHQPKSTKISEENFSTKPVDFQINSQKLIQDWQKKSPKQNKSSTSSELSKESLPETSTKYAPYKFINRPKNSIQRRASLHSTRDIQKTSSRNNRARSFIENKKEASEYRENAKEISELTQAHQPKTAVQTQRTPSTNQTIQYRLNTSHQPSGANTMTYIKEKQIELANHKSSIEGSSIPFETVAKVETDNKSIAIEMPIKQGSEPSVSSAIKTLKINYDKNQSGQGLLEIWGNQKKSIFSRFQEGFNKKIIEPIKSRAQRIKNKFKKTTSKSQESKTFQDQSADSSRSSVSNFAETSF